MIFTDNACRLRLEYNRVFIWGRGRGSYAEFKPKNIYWCLHSGVRDWRTVVRATLYRVAGYSFSFIPGRVMAHLCSRRCRQD